MLLVCDIYINIILYKHIMPLSGNIIYYGEYLMIYFN